MRVISGSARGVALISPKGDKTRPTADRIKEDIFNIISGYIEDADFLDLYAGSGAMGIEALSRGARSAAFVEKDRETAGLIEKNTEKAKLDRYRIVRQDVLTAISCLNQTFDVIFMDPPYEKDIVNLTINEIEKNHILNAGGLLVIEAGNQESVEYSGYFELIKTKKYKIAVLYFLKRSEDL